MPPDFLSAWQDASQRFGIDPARFEALGSGLSGGILIGTLAVSVMPLIMRRFGGKTPVLTGDIAALIPRNRAEIRWGAVISVNAGIIEEIFFRLLMPLTWFALTGNVITALFVSVVLFGLVHAYQGVVGVLATMAIGAVLTMVYLATQQIWIAIFLHALIDLRVLVFLPLAKKDPSNRPVTT